MKKLLAFILSAALAASCSLTALAEDSSSSAPDYSNVPPAAASGAYVVMDANTGQVLLEKNMNRKAYPASITKIMTAALGLEHNDLDDTVTVNQSAVFAIEPNSTHIALQPDEQIRMKDLLYATLVHSANDAANVIAEQTSGSIGDFAKLMNEKAAELGCKGTHFTNPSGLPEDDHYTTAYDMALITRYALNVPGFEDAFGYPHVYTIQPTNKQPNVRRFGTEHMMLVESKYYYPGTLGGKLGWTEEAKHTSVTLAERDGVRLICVILDCAQKYDKFTDSIALFDYCFTNFQPIAFSSAQLKKFTVSHFLPDGGSETIEIQSKDSYPLLLHRSLSQANISIEYEVPEYYGDGDTVDPQVEFRLRGSNGSMYENLGRYPMDHKVIQLQLDAAASTEPAEPVTLGDGFIAGAKKFFLLLGKILLGLAALAALLFLVMVVIRYVNKYRKWKQRRARSRRPPQGPDLSYRNPRPANRQRPPHSPPSKPRRS